MMKVVPYEDKNTVLVATVQCGRTMNMNQEKVSRRRETSLTLWIGGRVSQSPMLHTARITVSSLIHTAQSDEEAF